MDDDQEKFDAADLIIPPIGELTVVGSVIFRDDGVDEEQERFEDSCSQCGEKLIDRACGPTHALLKSELAEQEKFEADWTATKNEPCKVPGCREKQYGESGVCFRHLLDEVRGEKYSRLDGKS